MLWKVNDLKSFSLRATDGVIGEVEEMFVSDDAWVVRYVIVRTGGWLDREHVLISPLALDVPNGPARTIPVSLSQEQVRNAPTADSKRTVSRENEVKYHDYYGWPYYWVGGPMWGPFMTPGELARAEVKRADKGDGSPRREPRAPSRLRSTEEVRGYGFEGADGDLGHIDDFVVDDEDWSVRYLVIDTRNWWPGGKKVLLPTALVHEISWDAQKVTSNVSRETVKSAPEYEESLPIPVAFQRLLAQHYGLSEAVAGFR